MFKKFTLAGAAFAMGAVSLIPATPAMAQRYDRSASYDRYGNAYYGDQGYRGYENRNYRSNRYNSYRYSNRCKDGDGGTIIGAVAGGLAGREIAGRGDRTLGTILGGVLGAVAGRAIDKADRPRGC